MNDRRQHDIPLTWIAIAICLAFWAYFGMAFV